MQFAYVVIFFPRKILASDTMGARVHNFWVEQHLAVWSIAELKNDYKNNSKKYRQSTARNKIIDH